MSVLTAAQFQIPFTPPANVPALVDGVCAEAVARGANLAALPEMFCCPYDVSQFSPYAQPEGGEIWQACADAARKHRIYLSAGSVPERDGAGHIYNTAYVFDPAGRQIARHRKVHLFDISVEGGQHFQESATLTPGEEITTFETDFGVLGLCICYDFRFPELGRLMALKGARAVLVPAAFNMTTGPAHWSLTFRAQAVFNQFFALGTAPARDPAGCYVSWGHTVAVDPWGAVLGELDEKKGVLVTALDFARADAVREQLPLLRHRRPDVYARAGGLWE